MPVVSKVPLASFMAQCEGQMVPLSKSLSYFAAFPLEENDLRKLLYDPVAAIPPKIGQILPHLRFVLVPYLEKESPDHGPNGSDRRESAASKRLSSKNGASELVSYSEPTRSRQIASASSEQNGELFLFLAVKAEDLAEYHYTFYNSLAALLTPRLEAASIERFQGLIRDELTIETHGEVDEKSWRLKEKVTQRKGDPTRDSKPLQDYFRQAMEDTLTLYLHGLCCDIDVDAGPRQLASRYVRRRLLLLRELFPPPEGFALFPEEL
jgi:hypothetical protein